MDGYTGADIAVASAAAMLGLRAHIKIQRTARSGEEYQGTKNTYEAF